MYEKPVGIEKLRQNVETVTTSLDRKFQELHDHIDTETSVLTSRIDDIEIRISSLEQKPREPFDPGVSIVGLGIKITLNEDATNVARQIIDGQLGLSGVHVVQALRLDSRNDRPGLMKIELENKKDKILVLKNQKKLLDSAEFRGVFLKSSQSHIERLIELNFKTILSEIPNGGHYRVTGCGRIVKK